MNFIQNIILQHKEAISNLSFAKDEASLLACASLDGTLSICEVSPTCRVLHLLSGHAAGVTGMSLINFLYTVQQT